jgi:ApaG protein
MFQAVTEDIKIEVEPQYIPDQSDPTQAYYFFSYRVRITNQSSTTVKLISRHWIITDGFGQIEEVEGPGVVGKQPTLKAGESFEYSSFCPLATPTGTMQGSYHMTNLAGREFEVSIPLFILSEPNQFH